MTLKIAIIKGGVLSELPRPISSFRILERWDSKTLKVPLLTGDIQTGVSRNGIDLVIDGEYGIKNDIVFVGEQQMHAEYQAIRNLVDTNADDADLEVLVSHLETLTSGYLFKRCRVAKFETDFSNPHIYEYQLVLHAGDPVMYDYPSA